MEVAYKGTRFSGFQVQENAVTIQGEVEKAFGILHKDPFMFTGSSRTDAGVHARSNFFHLDGEAEVHHQIVYKMNALLPHDIVVRRVVEVEPDLHARFHALYRRYRYRLHTVRDPFLDDYSVYFPYALDRDIMEQGAAMIMGTHDFFAFSKSNSQVKTTICEVMESRWEWRDGEMVYVIRANRFLRGMVRALTAVLLRMGRGKAGMEELENWLKGGVRAGYSVPARGLMLDEVYFDEKKIPLLGGALGRF